MFISKKDILTRVKIEILFKHKFVHTVNKNLKILRTRIKIDKNHKRIVRSNGVKRETFSRWCYIGYFLDVCGCLFRNRRKEKKIERRQKKNCSVSTSNKKKPGENEWREIKKL